MDEKKWDRLTITLSPELKEEVKVAVEESKQTQADFLQAALAAYKSQTHQQENNTPEIGQVRTQFSRSLQLVEAVLIRAANQEVQAHEDIRESKMTHAENVEDLNQQIQDMKDRIQALEAENNIYQEKQESYKVLKSAHQVEKDLWLVKEKEMDQSIARKNEELVKANELSASSRCDIDSLNKRISDLTSGNNALLKKITEAQHEYELKIKEL
ncbi:MAG: hypothetical protein GY718_19985, partial [Lentisphaerae bacterium]|nr:hypothetical protein [Lentisphaerota bacterium]